MKSKFLEQTTRLGKSMKSAQGRFVGTCHTTHLDQTVINIKTGD